MPGLVPGIHVFERLLKRRRKQFLQHFRWRDIYHFVRASVYQQFRWRERKCLQSLHVSALHHRL